MNYFGIIFMLCILSLYYCSPITPASTTEISSAETDFDDFELTAEQKAELVSKLKAVEDELKNLTPPKDSRAFQENAAKVQNLYCVIVGCDHHDDHHDHDHHENDHDNMEDQFHVPPGTPPPTVHFCPKQLQFTSFGALFISIIHRHYCRVLFMAGVALGDRLDEHHHNYYVDGHGHRHPRTTSAPRNFEVKLLDFLI